MFARPDASFLILDAESRVWLRLRTGEMVTRVAFSPDIRRESVRDRWSDELPSEIGSHHWGATAAPEFSGVMRQFSTMRELGGALAEAVAQHETSYQWPAWVLPLMRELGERSTHARESGEGRSSSWTAVKWHLLGTDVWERL